MFFFHHVPRPPRTFPNKLAGMESATSSIGAAPAVRRTVQRTRTKAEKRVYPSQQVLSGAQEKTSVCTLPSLRFTVTPRVCTLPMHTRSLLTSLSRVYRCFRRRLSKLTESSAGADPECFSLLNALRHWHACMVENTRISRVNTLVAEGLRRCLISNMT